MEIPRKKTRIDQETLGSRWWNGQSALRVRGVGPMERMVAAGESRSPGAINNDQGSVQLSVASIHTQSATLAYARRPQTTDASAGYLPRRG